MVTHDNFSSQGNKKPISRKHVNIFLTALVGQSSQGRTPTHPRDKRDKMAICCGIEQQKAGLSQGWVPICPGDWGSDFLFLTTLLPFLGCLTLKMSNSIHFGPFRVRFGPIRSVSGGFLLSWSVGWGRGGVGERGFCKGKE